MPLWTKNGSYPVSEMPPAEPDASGRMWSHLEDNEEGRAALGWTEAPEPPEYDFNNEQLAWNVDEWVIEEKVLAEHVIRVSHKEFLDLLTAGEQISLKAKQKEIDDLTADEFMQPAHAGLQMFSIVMDQFEKSTFIELTHPQTIAAIRGLLVPIGILSSDRADAVLLGQHPA